jgi:hypothetical protein
MNLIVLESLSDSSYYVFLLYIFSWHVGVLYEISLASRRVFFYLFFMWSRESNELTNHWL